MSPAETEHFRTGFVSIVGRPNTGKSTLLNALIGEKVAITARQAQTTRTSVQGVLTGPEAQIVFVDTPGIHQSDTLFNKKMMHTVRDALSERDLVLFVADSGRSIDQEDEYAVSVLRHTSKALLVLNKIDRVDDKRLLLPLTERYFRLHPFVDMVPVSARREEGLEDLKRVLINFLPEGQAIFPEDHFTDQPIRFLAGEIIREKILRSTQDEVPHAVAVLIEQWETKEGLTKIAATIHVERPGQKTILIGKGGATLKEIGTSARQEIEKLTGAKVFLSLFVKVKRNWREDPSFLEAIDWRAMVGSK